MSKTHPKQVIVMRKDLNMRKGKMISQGAHASLGGILNFVGGTTSYPSTQTREITLRFNDESPVLDWLNGAFTKITVSVDSEQELLDIVQKAKDSGINVKLITDNGLTEFNGVHTHTCCAIGPDYPEKIDPLTGHLKLL